MMCAATSSLVALLVNQPQLIVARKTMPASDLKDFITWLRANPDKATHGTSGPGSLIHYAGALFQRESGTRTRLVPYRGASQTVQDLVSGQIDMMIDPAANSLPHVRAGGIKAYAVTAGAGWRRRPTYRPSTKRVCPDFTLRVGRRFGRPRARRSPSSPRSMPQSSTRWPILRCGSALPISGPEVFPREQQTPEALAAFQRAEIEKWWPIIKAANIKVE